MTVTLDTLLEKLVSMEKATHELRVEMQDMKAELSHRLDKVENSIEKVDQRLNTVENRLEKVEGKLNGIGEQFEVSAKHRQDAEEQLSKTLKYLLDTTTNHAIELHAFKHKQ